ncbi:MAG: DUF6390 family protein, partial [Nocardioidaceae bacterium]
GYCGPRVGNALLEYGAAGVTDPGLTQHVELFPGVWPNLNLIASSAHIVDPLDSRVVEAFWVGNELLERVDTTSMGNAIEDRFRYRTGQNFSHIADGVVAGGVPHHNFSVFVASPWGSLLGQDRKTELAVSQLDRCRIRWGQVVSVSGDEAVVRFRPLIWDGAALVLDEPQVETAQFALSGTAFLPDLAAGDVVSLHWDWVCDRLTPNQLRMLQHYTAKHLKIANAGLATAGSPLPRG